MPCTWSRQERPREDLQRAECGEGRQRQSRYCQSALSRGGSSGLWSRAAIVGGYRTSTRQIRRRSGISLGRSAQRPKYRSRSGAGQDKRCQRRVKQRFALLV